VGTYFLCLAEAGGQDLAATAPNPGYCIRFADGFSFALRARKVKTVATAVPKGIQQSQRPRQAATRPILFDHQKVCKKWLRGGWGLPPSIPPTTTSARKQRIRNSRKDRVRTPCEPPFRLLNLFVRRRKANSTTLLTSMLPGKSSSRPWAGATLNKWSAKKNVMFEWP